MISIEQLGRPQRKREVCQTVLQQLPSWQEYGTTLQECVLQVAGLRVWCAMEETEPVGFAALKRHSDAASEIYMLCVLPQYRRQGVGRMLLWEMEDQCMAWGNNFLTAKTFAAAYPSPEQEQLRSFYSKMGFKTLEVLELQGAEQERLLLCKGL
jgi:GNAT superfamily N-acetyltransferase